jgi:hypothetical protein
LAIEQVITFMADNASNNDTMCDTLKALHNNLDLEFNVKWARLRCMPHTTHLSALTVWIFLFCYMLIDQGNFFLKLLEGIGAIKEADKKRNNYQDSVTTPLSQEFDDDAVGLEDQPEDKLSNKAGNYQEVLSAIEKVKRSSYLIKFNTYNSLIVAQNCSCGSL